jgi:predicted ATPase
MRIENFKSWSRARIEFGRVTGIFGTNSSGKTSLLQFLLLLKQTKDVTDRRTVLDFGGPDRLVDLGTFQDVISRHDQARSLSWSLRWYNPEPLRISNPAGPRTDILVESNSLRIAADVVLNRGRLTTRELEYDLGKAKFSLSAKETEGRTRGYQLTSTGLNDFRFLRTMGRAWELPGPVKSYAFPDQARTYFQNSGFLSELESAYEFQMDKVFYLGPLREYPKRDYYWSKTRPSDVGWKGERTIEAILAATADNETHNLKFRSPRMSFQAVISHWLKEMKLIDAFRMEEIGKDSNRWQAKVRVAPEAPEVLLTDVGFGVSQVLPVLTLMYFVGEGATIILEQPEIHLHPFAQSALADVVLNVAKNRKIQFIIESHSEHFLQRLQRRVAEGLIESDKIQLYFVSMKNGESALQHLELDLFGSILNWPEQFFGDPFAEAAAIEKARIRRMKAQ